MSEYTSELVPLQILGIDAAVAASNIGLAVAVQRENGWQVQSVQPGSPKVDVVDAIVGLLDPSLPLLVAIDAPLGWPEALAKVLPGHAAGQALNAEASALFARETDRFVHRKTGLKPLDVGADRIARTAAAALALIDACRQRTGHPLPLLTGPEHSANSGLIEVYPAATLKQRGLPYRQYKKPEATAVRQQIATAIQQELDIENVATAVIQSDHCLDAALCVLTATDFLAGRCHPPPDPDLFVREGWIWFSSNEHTAN